MRPHLLLVLLSGALLGAQSPPEDRPLTIEEAVRIALERHPDVEKARAAAEALKGKIREVRAQALPDVAIHVNATRWRDPSLLNASGIEKFPEELRKALIPQGVNLFDYNITVRQPLYTAGKVGTALRLAAVEAEGSAAEMDRAAQDLALNVVRACYGLLWAERYLALVEETQRQRQAHLETARARYRNGVATEVDVLRSEVALANGEPELVRARNAIRQARALLNFYLVRPLDFPTRLAASLEEVAPWEQWDLEALAAEASRRRPELLRLRIAERSAETQLELARAESRMRADFTGSYGVMARLPENLVNSQFVRWIVGVNFTLPVFDGFRRSGLVWQATAARRAARLEREKVEQQVRLALQQALDDLRAAQQTVEAARANVRQAERVLEMTQNNYQYGAATTLDVVDAQTALTLARTNLLKGLHDYGIARANLLWAMGRRPEEK
ncbi:MAG: TolC family protein [Bryobacterales bacterium]|nr:TolC family protein [Bryobacteraceae bacterium]MDW8353759.1 TolC family protein [Bryobacterales bacterium]